MIGRLRSPVLKFALLASFGIPMSIVSLAHAQQSPKKARSVWNSSSSDSSKPCYICASPTPAPKDPRLKPLLPYIAPVKKNSAPFKVQGRDIEKPPQKPLIVTSSTKEWEDFWGIIQPVQEPGKPVQLPRPQVKPRPAIQYLTWRNYRTAYTRTNIEKLNKASEVAVMKPREMTRGRGKRKYKVTVRGNNAKQLCYRAVKETLLNAGIVKDYIPGQAAQGAATYLKAQKYPNGSPMFVDIAPRLQNDANAAPPGAIIVYRGGQWGHIELKIKDQYCSDHCNAVPMNEKISRYVIGIFLPITEEQP